MLFKETSHTKEYGVHVYGSPQESPEFLQAAFLYHPSVVDRSLAHDGSGETPGRKLPEGGWDLRPHADRIVHVDSDRLEAWAQLMAYDEALSAPVVKIVTTAEAAAVDAIARYPETVRREPILLVRRFPRAIGPTERSGGGTNRGAFRLGRGDSPRSPHRDQHTVREAAPTVVPHTSRTTTHGTWSNSPRASFQELTGNARPTAVRSRKRYLSGTMPEVPTAAGLSSAERLASNMYRSVFVSLMPPKATTMSVCYTGWYESDFLTAAVCGLASSLLWDFRARITGVSHLHDSTIARFPVPDGNHPLTAPLVHRTLRLNCLTREYAGLWAQLFDPDWHGDEFTQPQLATRSIAAPPPVWDMGVPVRTELDRWLLLTELDALRRPDVGRGKRRTRGRLQLAVSCAARL